MSPARIRLIVAALLFFGWLGWLGYLAYSKTRPVIVSHSQVMAADRFVVAEVTLAQDTGSPNKAVTVIEDLRPVGQPLSGAMEVRNIELAEVTGGHARFQDRGRYLLMLTAVAGAGERSFELTRPPGRVHKPPGAGRVEPGRPWAYVWDNDEVRRQFEALVGRR